MRRRALGILACSAAAAACLGTAGYDLARALRMSRWPAAQGRVIRSEVKMVAAGTRYRYFTDVEIEYQVAGTAHTTHSVRADSAMSSGDRDWAERVAGEYPKGRRVEVRFRPEHPRDARVEIWPQPAIWMLAVWGGCALFGALWLARRAGTGRARI